MITADTSGLGEIRNLVGGTGTAEWKQVINGMHLPGKWGCVEYVKLGPGSSCGRHLHDQREEIYYILSGSAAMTVNGEEIAVAAGDMITCPLGTIHGIGVPDDAAEAMTFFVVEVFPGSDPPPGPPVRISMPARLELGAGYRGGAQGLQTRVAVVDLTGFLTGPWRRFALAEIPPGDALGPYRLPSDVGEVLFVTSGEAEIAAEDVIAKGGTGFCVGTPLAARVTVRNLSSAQPLTLISTEVAGLWTSGFPAGLP